MVVTILEKPMENEDGQRYTGYGIRAEEGLLCQEIHDISPNLPQVESYAAILIDEKVPFESVRERIEELVDGSAML